MTSPKRTGIPKPSVSLKDIPAPTPPSRVKRWTFSFSHWKQIKYFGLDTPKADREWFVSLLEKLKELSRFPLDEFLTDGQARDTWRYHPVKWTQPGIPITKHQFLELIPKDYHNEQYEIVQLQITTALGRVVGFFDEDRTFQVVLLDPDHHIQPTKFSGYKTTPTGKLLSKYQKRMLQLISLARTLDHACAGKPCDIKQDLPKILKESLEKSYICLNDFSNGDVEYLLATHYDSPDDLILAALDLLYTSHGLSEPSDNSQDGGSEA